MWVCEGAWEEAKVEEGKVRVASHTHMAPPSSQQQVLRAKRVESEKCLTN